MKKENTQAPAKPRAAARTIEQQIADLQAKAAAKQAKVEKKAADELAVVDEKIADHLAKLKDLIAKRTELRGILGIEDTVDISELEVSEPIDEPAPAR